jgi:NitT/TauT family transport system ATP-binding protein
VQGVRKGYGDVAVLDGIDLSVGPRGRLAVLGPTGCGKSTLLSAIAGLIEPDAGTIAVGAATSSADRLARCVLMPQRDLLLPWRSALDNAALALENRGLSRRDARARASPLFERFGLAGFAGHRPAALSGGMRQRVAFLRTLVAEKEVLLLDEPFATLDAITRAQTQEWLLGAFAEAPRTAVLVTHDVEEALLLADRVAVLSPRPARVVELLETAFETRAPRREIVTSVEFAALKERALEALGC